MGRPKRTREESNRLLRERLLRKAKKFFKEAQHYESFMADPGVNLGVILRMYSGANKNYVLLPGWRVDVTVQRWEDIEEMEEVVRHALVAWANGRWDRSLGRLRCARCEEE